MQQYTRLYLLPTIVLFNKIITPTCFSYWY